MTVFAEHGATAQFDDHPARRYYTGGDLMRALDIDDLRARAHRLMPRFVLEYLEGGAGTETTLRHEREVYGRWLFMPHTLTDEEDRTLSRDILGRGATMPLLVGPTGLNGLFMRGADLALARASARFGVPFVQSTMSNERMEDIARIPNVRHWWQLYMFGPDEVWQSLVDRAAACGCEALVVTTNSQIFGQRQWSSRTRRDGRHPSAETVLDAILHPGWLAHTLTHGMPVFANVIDYVPRDKRGFFDSAFWIRQQMPQNLAWRDVAKIRQRWKNPMFVKGVLNPDDVRRALDAGVDGVMIGSHGGRQADSAVSALDILQHIRTIVDGRMAVYASGGIRHGVDMLKAMALGADAVLSGRAVLYGLCAGGEDGALRALHILFDEALNELGQVGVADVDGLRDGLLVRASNLPLAA